MPTTEQIRVPHAPRTSSKLSMSLHLIKSYESVQTKVIKVGWVCCQCDVSIFKHVHYKYLSAFCRKVCGGARHWWKRIVGRTGDDTHFLSSSSSTSDFKDWLTQKTLTSQATLETVPGTTYIVVVNVPDRVESIRMMFWRPTSYADYCQNSLSLRPLLVGEKNVVRWINNCGTSPTRCILHFLMDFSRKLSWTKERAFSGIDRFAYRSARLNSTALW